MKIGIIVEGQEEQQSLRYIVEKIRIEGKQILAPIFAPIEPKATPQQIIKAMESRLKLLSKADKIIVLIDIENLDVCPGDRASSLERVFIDRGYENIEVVIKKRQFENWLIADPDAISQLRNFDMSEGFRRSVNNNADNVDDPVRLLSNIKNDRRYFHKTKDGSAIAKQVDYLRIASNSRSFRRFLRVLGYPLYLHQSKRRVSDR